MLQQHQFPISFCDFNLFKVNKRKKAQDTMQVDLSHSRSNEVAGLGSIIQNEFRDIAKHTHIANTFENRIFYGWR